MSTAEAAAELAAYLTGIETAARLYDSGQAQTSLQIAHALKDVFHQTGQSTSLLARLLGRLTKVATTVGKPPYPRGGYSPMARMRDPFHAESFVIAPMTSGPVRSSPAAAYDPPLNEKGLTRFVPATEWWANEPVVIVDGRKVTRRDVVLAVTDPDPNAFHPAAAAYPAVLRQMAFEVQKSPELHKLAKR